MKKYVTILLSLLPCLINAQFEKNKTYNSISLCVSPDLNLYTSSQTKNLNYKGNCSTAYRFKLEMKRPFSKIFEFKIGFSYGQIKSNLIEDRATTSLNVIKIKYKMGIFSTGIQYFWKKKMYSNFDVGLVLLNQYGQPLDDLSVAPLIGGGIGWQQTYKNISMFMQPSIRYMFKGYGINDLQPAKLLPAVSLGFEIGVRSYIYRRLSFRPRIK